MQLSTTALGEINPYFVLFSADGVIIALGPLAKRVAGIQRHEATTLDEIITVERPILIGIDEMISHARQLIVFRFAGSIVPMRGQIIPDNGMFVLVSNPWVSTDEEHNELPDELLKNAHHESWSDYYTISQIFRHQTEELEKTILKLSRSESQLRNIINGVVEAIVIIDVVGNIVQVNPAFQKMFGYDSTELLGHNISLIMPEPHRSQHNQYLGQYLATGEGRVIGIGRDVTGIRKDGSIVPVHLSVSVATSFGNKYFVGIMDDISARKQMEKLKDDFISTVSHELKTPLTSVLSSFEFLEDLAAKERNPDLSKWVQLGSRNAKRLKELVTGILSVEKLSSGTFSITGESIEIKGLLSKFRDAQLDFLQTIASGTEFKDTDASAIVVTDFQAFSLVMVNLLRNAARHSRSTAPIQIGVESVTESEVVFFVRDFGIGIAPEQQKAIFEKFYRIGEVDARHTSGTGLGLSIAKSVLERMHGRIWLESSPGKGSTFFFSLPRD